MKSTLQKEGHQMQQELIPVKEETQLATQQPTPLTILQSAVERGADIDTIERLVALQERMMDRAAKSSYNEALARIQKEIKRIAPDLVNPSKSSKYASYAAIDRVIRPIYSAEGMSLSFTHADSPKADHVRIVCKAALAGHVEQYQIDMPVDTQGPRGGDVMTKTHATAAADSYGKRYLVKDIFNVAVGEDDVDGNATNGELQEQLEYIDNCRNPEELKRQYKIAYEMFEAYPPALKEIIKARKLKAEKLAKGEL